MRVHRTGRLLSSILLCGLTAFVHGAADNCIEFEINGGIMQFPISIQDQSVTARINGSNTNFISQGLVDELNLKVQSDPNRITVRSDGEEGMYTFVTDIDAGLFGTNLRLEHLAVDTSNPGKDISMSLMLFDGSVVQINYPGTLLCFYNRESVNLIDSSNIDFGSATNFGNPVVRVRLNDTTNVWLQVNFGVANSVTIDRATASALDLIDSDREEGLEEIWVDSSIDVMNFGPYELGNVSARYPKARIRDNVNTGSELTTGTYIQRSREASGSLDMEVLRHFVITLDRENERMNVYLPR